MPTWALYLGVWGKHQIPREGEAAQRALQRARLQLAQAVKATVVACGKHTGTEAALLMCSQHAVLQISML